MVVALETVLGEALDDSLEEGDEECDLLAEPSFPDNSRSEPAKKSGYLLS